MAFVHQVGWSSLIVSLLAGAAGMLSLTSAMSAVLVGVFISVAMVLAARYAVVAATLGDWAQCAGSFGRLVVNLVGIIASASVVLALRWAGGRAWPAGCRCGRCGEACSAAVPQFSRPCNAVVAWFRQRLRGDYVRWPVEEWEAGLSGEHAAVTSADRSCVT